jgi:hypothetical protein
MEIDASDMAKDLAHIASAIFVAGGNPENIVFVAGPQAAITLRLTSSPNFTTRIRHRRRR